MPKWKYALEPGGKKSLEISMGTFIWQKKAEVRLNGNLIGVFPNQEELAKGQVLQLPDGTTLRIQFVKTFSSLGFRVLRNDKPLPGSKPLPKPLPGPAERLHQSSGAIYFIAVLNLVLGFLALIFQVKFLQTLGFGIFSVASGFILLVLGFFTRRRSLIALIIALIIYGLDSALWLFIMVSSLALSSGTNMDSWFRLFVVGIGVRILFLSEMGMGVGAINKLKKETPPTVS